MRKVLKCSFLPASCSATDPLMPAMAVRAVSVEDATASVVTESSSLANSMSAISVSSERRDVSSRDCKGQYQCRRRERTFPTILLGTPLDVEPPPPPTMRKSWFNGSKSAPYKGYESFLRTSGTYGAISGVVYTFEIMQTEHKYLFNGHGSAVARHLCRTK